MKKIKDGRTHIHGFHHYYDDFGDGSQTYVYLGSCKYKCNSFCQGHFIKEHPFYLDETEKDRYDPDELVEYLMQEQRLCVNKKLTIVFAGREPLTHPWFCVHVARKIKQAGMGVMFRTCGAIDKEWYLIVGPYTDLFLFDMITVIPSSHKHLCGFPLQRTLDCLSLLDGYHMPYRLRFRIIQGVNDEGAVALAAFCSRLKSVKSVMLDFSASQLNDEEIRSFRREFLDRGVVLY